MRIAVVLLFFISLAGATDVYAAVTKAEVKDISDELICYCGCANKVVATCGCGTADMIESDIAQQLEAGKTKDDIIAAYVAVHGVQGLATPPARGFNLSAWIIPIAALLAGGLVIRTAVIRWRARGRETEVQRDRKPEPVVAAVKHQNQIQRELKELD